jgi:peptide/nickel transport system substrate-binding protein
VTRALAATLLAALLLVPAAGTRGIKEGGTFRVGIAGDLFDSIDPALSEFPATIPVFNATCGHPMTTLDKPFPAGRRVVPEIAKDYPKIAGDGKTYTFRIRKGLRFSTGAPVTAHDVAHTINRLLNPNMKAVYASLFQDVVGAQAVLDGKATSASGIVARGDTLTIRLTKPLGDFQARLTVVCVVPRTLPADPEGAKAPIPSAGPYYVSEYVPGVRVVLERNRFYRGGRPHHVDRILVDLSADSASDLARVDRGELDYAWVPTSDYAERATEFRQKYGLNKSRFFSTTASFLRFFALNTARPLFRNNPQLRQAVNFAVDRKALLRERGPLAGYATDQYLTAAAPGFRDERIYPLKAPDLRQARALARGHTRGGKAVLYIPASPLGLAQGQILKANLKQIGIDVEIKQFPGTLFFDKLATRGEPFDIGWMGWLANFPDPDVLNDLFDGRKIGDPSGANYSYFNSPKYNALLKRAATLTGAKRDRAYGNLDIDLARNAAPAIAYAYDSALTLVSARTGCVVVNPYLDLAAACLK